jgi:hypothetical protein
MSRFFKYAVGRFVDPAKVVGASIYNKDNQIKVAIDLDVQNVEKATVFSGPFQTVEEAERFILTIPSSE